MQREESGNVGYTDLLEEREFHTINTREDKSCEHPDATRGR